MQSAAKILVLVSLIIASVDASSARFGRSCRAFFSVARRAFIIDPATMSRAGGAGSVWTSGWLLPQIQSVRLADAPIHTDVGLGERTGGPSHAPLGSGGSACAF